MTYKTYYAFALILFVPWIITQLNLAPPADAIFLFTGAQYFLDGLSMRDFYYDGNPPMCFFIYIPAVFLEKTGIPTYFVIQTYALILIALSAISLKLLLDSWPDLRPETKFMTFVFFLIGIGPLALLEFGQKDHLITLALIPFIILQGLITTRTRTSMPLKLITIALCIPFILVKPHYGLLPVCMLLHRAYMQRRITIFKDIDFIALAIGTILYVGYVFFYMPDYINEILPENLKLYVFLETEDTTKILVQTLSFLFFLMMLFVILIFQNRNKNEKNFTLTLCALSALSILPFYIQGKGFSVHLIPAIGLTAITLGAGGSAYIKSMRHCAYIIIPIILCIYIFCTYFIYSKQAEHSFHKDYIKSDLVKLIKDYAGEKPFFIEGNSSCTNYGALAYLDNKAASRFSSVWFVSNALQLNGSEKIDILDKLGGYIAEDINNYRPQMLAFMLNKNGKSPLLITYNNHKPFQSALQRYEYKDTVSIKTLYPCFYDDEETAIFDIFVRGAF